MFFSYQTYTNGLVFTQCFFLFLFLIFRHYAVDHIHPFLSITYTPGYLNESNLGFSILPNKI